MHYLSVLALTFGLTHSILALPHERRVAAGLNAGAQAAGKLYFGTATDARYWSDTAYDKILDNLADFGQMTPENSMKWGATEAVQNRFTFDTADKLVSLAEKTKKILRCHNLVWHASLPSWVTHGKWTNETLTAAMKHHVTSVATHFKGKCYAWDVVNEALNPDGTYGSNVFYDTIGPQYIAIAFAAAAAADPDAKLYYNDYDIQTVGAKSQGAQNLIKSLRAQGIKIDGIGVQAHYGVGEGTPSLESQKKGLAAFTALGVEVALTELDIHMKLPSTPSLLETQRTNFADTVSACVHTKGCVGITVWGFTDKHSWFPKSAPGNGAANLWDVNLVKKPAYAGALGAFPAGRAHEAASKSSTVRAATATSPTVAATTYTTLTSTETVTYTETSTSTSKASSASSSTPAACPPGATVTTTVVRTTTLTAPSTQHTLAKKAASGKKKWCKQEVPRWGQCGGKNWTGPTACAAPWSCVQQAGNAYYSQCL